MANGARTSWTTWLVLGVIGAGLCWIGYLYSTGQPIPYLTDQRYSVSPKTFDEILATLKSRPSIKPKFSAPVPITPSDQTAGICNLSSQTVTFSRAKPAAGKGGTSDYTITTKTMPILTSEGAEGVLFAKAGTFAVNVDGSPRAYHPGDVYGRCNTAPVGLQKGKTVCAINFLCYAGVRVFEGGKEVRCGDRKNYQRAWNEMWNEIGAGRAVKIPRSYWRRGGKFKRRYGFFHATKPVTVMFLDSIIRKDAAGKPCVRNVKGSPYYGYFVAATSLTGDEGEDESEGRDVAKIVTDKRCDPIPFVDAEKLPSIVIPVGGFAGAKVGDLVVGYRRAASGEARWVYAIVGDQGPNHKFGEGSVAFNEALKGHKRRWKNYSEIVRKLHISAREKGASKVSVLIFKDTKAKLANKLSRKSVQSTAETLFKHWGGGSIDAAKKRFQACAATLR